MKPTRTQKQQPIHPQLLLFIGGTLGIGILLSKIAGFNPGFNLLGLISSTTQVPSQPVTLQQIQRIGELATIRWPITQPIPAEQSSQILGIPYASTKILVITQVDVAAGVDLGSIDAQAIQAIGNNITVTLPPPKILSATLDVHKSQIYDYNRGPLSLGPDVGPQLQAIAQDKAVKDGTQAACRNNILGQANNQAKTVLESLLKEANPSKVVTVTTAEPTSCTLPTSAN